MAISDESRATTRLLREALHHTAALKAHPQTAVLAPPVAEARSKLLGLYTARIAAEERSTEGLAVLRCFDAELDERLRTVELAVLGEVKKDRTNPAYRQAFPKGLTAMLALRGTEQARAVRVLIGVLRESFAPIAQAHAEALEEMCGKCEVAEREWQAAEDTVAKTFSAELVGRVELVRCLEKNEGALLRTFPGEKRRVRQFFLRARRGGGDSGEGDDEGGTGA